MTEAEEVWERLKYGVPDSTVIFQGNGTATKFNSAWISHASAVKITVADEIVLQPTQVTVRGNDVIFKDPPMHGDMVKLIIY